MLESSKSTITILIVIVAVLTLSLAVLAGYLFVVQGAFNGNEAAGGNGIAAEDGLNRVPKEEDLVKVPLFEEARYFNLKATEDGEAPIIQANVTLKCYKTLKNNKKAVVEDIISSRSEEIQELIVRFFMTLTKDEVKDPEILDKAKKELTRQINDLLNEGAVEPEDIVYNVIFSEWLFQ